MSIIAVASVGVGAAIGFGAVAASIATVTTVLTVAAVVGVIGIGLTVVGAVTHNKLLGQIGMVLGMGALGAVGGAAGAGALGLGAEAAAEASATGAGEAALTEGAAKTAATEGTAAVAPETVPGAVVPKGAPVGETGLVAPAEAPTNSASVTGAAKAPEGALAARAPVAAGENPNLILASNPGGEGSFANSGGGKFGYGMPRTGAVPNAPPSTSVIPLPSPPGGGVAPVVENPVTPSGWSKFWDSNAGGAVMAGAPGALIQGVGGMMQGAGASKAAEANYKLQQQQLALQTAQWQRGNSAAAVQFRQF